MDIYGYNPLVKNPCDRQWNLMPRGQNSSLRSCQEGMRREGGDSQLWVEGGIINAACVVEEQLSSFQVLSKTQKKKHYLYDPTYVRSTDVVQRPSAEKYRT